MTDKIDPRQYVLILLEQALATGVRGKLRTAIEAALQVAQGLQVKDLTNLQYDRLKPGEVLTDPERPGLTMRCGKRSGRSWTYVFTDRTGKKVRHVLGDYPAMGLAEARAEWVRLRDVVKRHGSIIEERIASTMTVSDLVTRYLEDYALAHKRSCEALDKRYLEKYVLPHYGALPASEFNASHVRQILMPIHARAPREAEKVRGVISSMFNIAAKGSRKIGNLDGSTWLAADTPNPASAVILPARRTESHLPTQTEMTALLRALDGMGRVGETIRLQSLTCARITEVAAMEWREVDFDARTWLLPALRSKNGKQHLVMLPCQAVALLESRSGNGSIYVFPQARAKGPTNRNAATKALASLREKLGLDPKFSSHSLRHACLTWLAEHGAGKEIRDRISNHSPDSRAADSVYNRAQLNQPAREWLQKWADHLEILETRTVG